MSTATLQAGRFTAGLVDSIRRPRIPARGRPSPVIYLHTATSDGSEALGVNFPAVEVILGYLADHGYTVLAPTMPPASFGNGAASPAAGNATGQGRLHDAITYASGTLGLTGKPILLGSSEGSTCALRYAALNPTAPLCVVTFLTVCDLTTAYTQNQGGNQAGIGTAYGVTYPAALPANSDPNLMTANFKVPMMLHHSSDDAYSTGLGNDEPIAGFCAATGATEVAVGALGHTNGSIAATNPAAVVDFIRAAGG